MPSTDPNPVSARLDRLHDQWTLFARDKNARILRWCLDFDELSLLETFILREADPDAADTPDLFWRSDAKFEHPERHGLDLREELRAAYDGEREALAQEKIDVWSCPPLRSGSTDIEAWLEALASFRQAHPGIEILAVWLRPETIADTNRYALWLQKLAQASPSELRFIVVDSIRSPALASLAKAEPGRIRTERAELDVPGALEELSASAGELDTPGGRFRHLYVRMGGAAKRGDLPAAEALGAEAIAVAQAERWFSLVGVVHFFLGSSLLGARRNVDAYHRFVLTERAGAKGEEVGDEGGTKMRLHGQMAAGSALLSEAAFAQAADVFSQAVPLARAAADLRAELDAWRLCSYGCQQSGQIERAWEAGVAGLRVARAMDGETRTTSTLRYLGEALLQLTENMLLRDHRPFVEAEVGSLLGQPYPSWLPAAAGKGA